MPNFISCFLILFAAFATFNFSPATADQELNTYIIHLAIPDRRAGTESLDKEILSHSLLSLVTNDKSRMVHIYHNVLNGFAAKLTPEEAQMLQNKDEVIQAKPQRTYHLLTTHSPKFLGLQRNIGVWSESNYGKGVIIAMLDTGIAPDHPSFHDKGMPPPPAKWRGKCEFNGKTTCNNKLIGARNFVEKSPGQPIDLAGHGTHTSSTAAGNFVDDANFFEEAKGTASGMAPYAHLALYRVCSSDCAETDILAAMDAAIDDGVDVISFSIGFDPSPFYTDLVAVASFVAMQNGIFVSASAGNGGSLPSSLVNESPWMLTVGASTIDRDEFRATALLGNNLQLDGESHFLPKDYPSIQLPLVYFPNTTYTYNKTAMFCAPGSLDNVDVKGKIVLCQRGAGINRTTKGQTVKDASGAGMILMNAEVDGNNTIADLHVLPATHVSYDAGQKILQYINSTSTPTATFLFKGTVFGIENSPSIASFSSRGPTNFSVGILKPDIIGPGVRIVAAWPFSVDNNTNTQSTFNMISGTSMSCPHLSGIAALIKSAHPDWSPAAIKSAIMTSANQLSLTSKGPILDERYLPANVFAKGAGHVNPQGAMNPGLIYDIKPDDYIPYLCGLGYNDIQLRIVVQRAVTCSTINAISGPQLNYPSFSIELKSNENVTYTRTVTNVGEAESHYAFGMELIPGVSMNVSPATLNFTQLNQNITYHITFARTMPSGINGVYVEGAVMWNSNKYTVRIPVSVKLI